MSPLNPRAGHGLLRCPICRCELTAAAGALVCRKRHGFDLAREGYVNLLLNRKRHPAAGGDDLAQLRNRAAFLEAGYFDHIGTTIARRVQPADAKPRPGPWHILDAGSGTGHHLAKLASALTPPVIGLGLDLAKGAARQASRRWPTLAFAVVDLWAEWPVHDDAVDLIISIFAPKNFAEAPRVLRPGGWLAVVYPGPDHMIELNERFRLLGQAAQKTHRYREAARHFIGPPAIHRLVSRVVLDAAAIGNAILMGPNARHITASTIEAASEPIAVTLDINVLFARKPESRPAACAECVRENI